MDRVAQRELYAQMAPIVANMARSRINWPDWEDVVSETFEVILGRWDILPKDPISRRAFVCATARNKICECYNKRKRSRRLQQKIMLEWEWWNEADVRLDPLDVVVEAEAAKLAFRSLGAADQEILNMVGVWNMSPDDAAASLGCSVSAVTTRTDRARKRLAAAYERLEQEQRDESSEILQ